LASKSPTVGLIWARPTRKHRMRILYLPRVAARRNSIALYARFSQAPML
jgi:hypothetical protein